MASFRGPHARYKPSDKPRLYGDAPPVVIEPEETIIHLQTLQEILSLARKIDRVAEGDERRLNAWRQTSEVSRWVWSEVGSLPITVAPSLASGLGAYQSLLLAIWTHLENDTMDPRVENWLNSQIDEFVNEFNVKLAMTRSTVPHHEHIAGSSFFPNAQNLLITGGNFISHSQDITGLQKSSDKMLRVVYFQTAVLFY
ncbi:hypothetical protein GALMADRAFT_270761 [Galerina marginata CBS 339.88]|uniref:Uncharacterized protein n=1 Tax=Galerina marginata (strain CBS 339.88) TaxID=685588 RepID=A0A067SMZ9_GALM3|nr:hypothetical protein GALMADRAFT_270761 [Galerina marginata CBS 339.88]